MEDLTSCMEGLALPEVDETKVGPDRATRNLWREAPRLLLVSRGWLDHQASTRTGTHPSFCAPALPFQGKQVSTEEAEEENVCAICLNAIELPEMAMLPCCDHLYCGE